ncbi:hypothetical protein GEOBRER4_n0691 [Citrifermentans bremense]|uniref:Uncharacterized protein n=1 Tax=Citrifermentans bremense TaxID=60035 RepID=A0A6S6LX60_9BACT|nr:hypothetical protein [Citrifermentans bremense]BCG45918.1 hypothetical protein GEOBRER4_n0691 [Citrifermentans bremense]
MDEKLARVAALAGTNGEVAETLDKVLTGPNDRAYLVCNYLDCKLNINGHCTIYTVLDVPRMKTGEPCKSYEKRQATGN